MARLTRMQKYAERRKEMANENEANQSNSALDAYKDKLNALEANFNELKKEETINIEPIITEEPVQEEPIIEDISKKLETKDEEEETDFLASLDIDNIDKAINDIFNQKISSLDDENEILNKVEKTIEETKVEKPVIEETLKEEIEIKQEEPIKEEVVEEPAKEEVIQEETEVVKEPIQEEVTEPKEEITEVKQEIIEEPIKEVTEITQEEIKEPVITRPLPVKEKEVVNIIDEDYKDIASKLSNIVEQLDGKVEPVKEEEKVLPKQEVVKEETTIEPIKEETVVETKTENVIEKPKEVVNVIDENYETIADKLSNEVTELNGEVEPVKEEEKPLEVTKEETVSEANEVTKEASLEDLTIEPINEEIETEIPETVEKSSDYVDEALKEAQEYNKQDGRKTVDDVKDMIVDDIRHNKPEQMDSEEFANTVSLEIDKVLSQIGNDIPSIDVADVTIDNVVAPIEIDTNKVADKLADTLKHPVLAKGASEEGVVEIKSMEETLTNDVVDDTIPFMMDDVKENNEVEYEEIDDEKPNKVLNIILVVLIVILVFILGVIAYYLLYAKGILG